MERKEIIDNSKFYVMGTKMTNPLLTDFYLLTMLYAHWKNNRHNSPAVFDMYYRKCPFGMNYSIFGGVDECFEFLQNFKINDEHIEYLKTQFPQAEKEFFDFLKNLNLNDINIFGFKNAELILPNEPLFRLEGALAKVQILETTLLNLCNYPTLIASLANKLKSIFGEEIKFIEDGSKFGQSAFGSILGVKYSCVGGVDSTTSVLASKLYNLNLFNEYTNVFEEENFYTREDLNFQFEDRDLNAYDIFINNFSDNLGTLKENKAFKNISKNFLFTILNLKNFNFSLSYQKNQENSLNFDDQIKLFIKLLEFSTQYKIITNPENVILYLKEKNILKEVRNIKEYIFKEIKKLKDLSSKISDINDLKKLFKIAIRYDVEMLKLKNNEIEKEFDYLFLGPEFLVSSTQPALGMVYKIMEMNHLPCIKFSEDKDKQTIPGSKCIFRIFDSNDNLIGDYLTLVNENDGFIKEKKIYAFFYNNFDEDSVQELRFEKAILMNPLIFSQGKPLFQLKNVDILQKRSLNNMHISKNNTKLYISRELRNIIVSETEKIKNLN